ncbi:hypothetical protein TWF106_009941 [Orbilia oligospora]|uniref:Uncharacterized protein n=1 Tax=Orbilia oligospora TaxID=2813651 RepID=A0A6G1MBC4_ORBOL|nr:hypothetical protein TWF788_004454 [Orbilia oligospora]KAF3216878.1 hypothetical protein TWF679_002715 [Orbilia oligospora]KAF3222163.1 hypothetical protein TWF191_006923 [Orbilia oligospora]KAF3227429.1 hypothetical protein TWF106_009941 [Orbilia oligospora]KAF3249995.1 hypothetical protein TWF192_005489 [Orbilia oligospora]
MPAHRVQSFPWYHSSRQKPRRWPLALRFIKGSVHAKIIGPIVFYTLFTALVVYIDQRLNVNLGVPSTVTPSLSIVVGLLLVFRNSSSYERFWAGRQDVSHIVSNVRNLSRYFMLCGPNESDEDRQDTERVVKTLVAMLFAMRSSLREDWGIPDKEEEPEYTDLLPRGIQGHENWGVALPLELAFFVEKYIRKGHKRGNFQAPQASMLTSQVNAIIDGYGHMETIMLTPIPVCYQIHMKQVLSLYCLFLPFSIVDDWNWVAVPMVALIAFTLYGIEGIGQEIENPFGLDRNDIKMDNIVRDARQEITTLLECWKQGKEEHFL